MRMTSLNCKKYPPLDKWGTYVFKSGNEFHKPTRYAVNRQHDLFKYWQKWLILPDVHRPFHNEVLWSKILKLISYLGNRLYGIILSGDYLDMYSLSNYRNYPGGTKGMSLDLEYKDGKRGLNELYKVLPSHARKIYIYGDRENTYFKATRHSNGNFQNNILSPKEALQLEENGWTVLTSCTNDRFKLGEYLEVRAGSSFASVKDVKQYVEELETSVIFGHTHKIEHFGLGKFIIYNIGWLGDLQHPQFQVIQKSQKNQWMNGFAFANLHNSGYFWVEPIQCFEGNFFYDGVLW